jgi:hypothetical protein
MLENVIDSKRPNEIHPAAQPSLVEPWKLHDVGQLGLPLRP